MKALLILSFLLSAVSAFASSSNALLASPSPDSLALDIQKPFEENKITDSELLSRQGSKSKLSMKFELEYDGPPVGDLSAIDQPNPDQTASPTATGLTGSVGTRYRFTPDSAISANVGLTGQYLFHGDKQNLDINDPFCFYEKSFRLEGMQMVGMFGGTVISSSVYKAKGETSGLDERLYSSYHLPGLLLSLGSTTKVQYYFFVRPYKPGSPKSGGDGKVRELSLVFAPSVKYNFGDKLNFNTSIHFNFFHPRGAPGATDLSSRLAFERVGVGYGITKAIYVDPYLQFYPTQFSWRTTTVNVTAVFSML